MKFKTERLDASVPRDIARAAQILRAGGTVAFPTETVYGLGANALSPEAVAKIFTAKQRPAWDPLIVHIADRAMLSQICDPPYLSFRSEAEEPAFLSAAAPPRAPETLSSFREALKPEKDLSSFREAGGSAFQTASNLMDHFWPGPLTLLLPRFPAIPDAVTAGRPLVGVRIPAHPVALELLRQAGVPIAAPSANTFGHTSPTTAAHVLADLDGRIDAVLDGGPCQVGLESTVAEVTGDEIVIYRAGAVSEEALEQFAWKFRGHHGAQTIIRMFRPQPASSPPQSLPSPGVGIRHYAPRARLILVATEPEFVHIIDKTYDGIETVGVLLPEGWNPSTAQLVFRWGPWHSTETLAQRLYAGLRDLDDRGATVIICPVPTSGPLAAAVRDRLGKAAREK